MLYICPTPIGNLEDITLRTLNVLKSVDIVLAEDTRHTRKLLTHFQIEATLLSMHQHNEKSRSEEIVLMLNDGKDVALVSDAGTPGISDPGGELIQKAIAESIEFTVLPGANAAIVALLHSGFLNDPFYFYGFLPRKKKEQSEVLKQLKNIKATLIFYESPHRVVKTLENILTILGDRECAICRELTKKFEEIKRGKIQEHISYFNESAPRGEFVLVIKAFDDIEEVINPDNSQIRTEVAESIEQGISKKDAIKLTAKKYKLAKNEVYQVCLDL